MFTAINKNTLYNINIFRNQGCGTAMVFFLSVNNNCKRKTSKYMKRRPVKFGTVVIHITF